MTVDIQPKYRLGGQCHILQDSICLFEIFIKFCLHDVIWNTQHV